MIKMNLDSCKRKEIAYEIGNFLNTLPCYTGTPAMAYKIGDCTLTKKGFLEFPEDFDKTEINCLLEHLKESGFEFLRSEPAHKDVLSVTFPVEILGGDGGYNRLVQLINSKKNLIKKVLGLKKNPEIEQNESQVIFPWFDLEVDTDSLKSYTQFLKMLCIYAGKAKRITAVEKSVENEKYAFRCFLLKIGLIGKEFAETRKILLAPLNGDAAFKNRK